MSTKHISIIAIISIALILLTQAYLVVDYFLTVKLALIRESDAIIKEAFRKDLNIRNALYVDFIDPKLTSRSVDSTSNKKHYVDFDMRITETDDHGILNQLDLIMHNFVSEFVPLDIDDLDSITGVNLKKRNIESKYYLKIVDVQRNELITQSKKLPNKSLLVIPSQLYPLDFEEKQALQLVLVNPFSEIMKRMGLMLLGSVVFSVICLLAFKYLIEILAKQKKLVAFKNEFLSNIAHELKRPVASLLVNIDCLNEPEFLQNDQLREMTLRNSTNSLTELNGSISMIVGLAKEEEGLLVLHKSQFDLVQLLNDLKKRFISTPSKQVKINAVYQLPEILVMADQIMLTQCFANLIDNSIKYSKSEVTIAIQVRVMPHDIELKFTDNGIGIPAEKIDTIFEKYSRVDDAVKVNGFGIGLNYVQTIIEKHNGSIEVTSELDKGTDFTITLPKK